MAAGISYDSREGRAIAGAISAVMTGVSYATSAEMAGSSARRGIRQEQGLDARVMRNHRAPRMGEKTGYEASPPCPCRSTSTPSRTRNSPSRRQRAWDDAVSLGEASRLPQRPVHRDRADRNDRPGDGLRPTGVEPDFALVKFKKLAGGGYFQDINRCVPEPWRPAIRPEQIDDIHRLCGWHATWRATPARINHDSLRARLATSRSTRRRGAGIGLRHPLRFQQMDVGAEFWHDQARHSTPHVGFAGLRRPQASGFSRSTSTRKLCMLRRDDRKGRAALKERHCGVRRANPCGRIGKPPCRRKATS